MSMNLKERMKSLVELRRKALTHIEALNRLTEEACKLTGEDYYEDNENSLEYIWNGGSAKHTLKMVRLYKEKRYKEAGKEIQKRYKFNGKGKEQRLK